jgi:type II secretory pathway pseudopilin PulG
MEIARFFRGAGRKCAFLWRNPVKPPFASTWGKPSVCNPVFQGAFTLVEVLVSCGLLGIVSLTLLGTFSTSFALMESSQENLRATQILLEQTEAIRLCNWAQLTNLNFATRYCPTAATNSQGGTLYWGTITTNAPSAIPTSASYQTNIRLVTITVTWTNCKPRPKSPNMDCKVISGNRCVRRRQRATAAFTRVELMVALSLATLVTAAIVVFNLFCLQSFNCLGNYTDMDNQSRDMLDVVCRDIREATAVTAIQTNLPILSLALTNANQGYHYTLTWNSNSSTFVYSNSLLGTQTMLTGCDNWNVGLFQRTPIITSSNIYFYSATNASGVLILSEVKLIRMSWHCYRTVFGHKMNTESMQTAQIVLRN